MFKFVNYFNELFIIMYTLFARCAAKAIKSHAKYFNMQSALNLKCICCKHNRVIEIPVVLYMYITSIFHSMPKSYLLQFFL